MKSGFIFHWERTIDYFEAKKYFVYLKNFNAKFYNFKIM